MTKILHAAAVAAIIAACSGTDPVAQSDAGNGPPLCTPGTAAACACVGGGQGAQVCQAAGTFGACVCGSTSGSSMGGSSASATSSGSSTSGGATSTRSRGTTLQSSGSSGGASTTTQACVLDGQPPGYATCCSGEVHGTCTAGLGFPCDVDAGVVCGAWGEGTTGGVCVHGPSEQESGPYSGTCCTVSGHPEGPPVPNCCSGVDQIYYGGTEWRCCYPAGPLPAGGQLADCCNLNCEQPCDGGYCCC